MGRFDPREAFQAAVREERGMKVTWPIGADLTVGAFGIINEDGYFLNEGRLQDVFDVEIDTETDETPDPATFQTTGTVSATAFAKGETGKVIGKVVAGKAGVDIAFSGEGAVVYRFEDVRVERVKDGLRLRHEIERLWDEHELKTGYVVMSQVAHASRGFALISTGSEGSAKLAVDADLHSGPIKIGEIKGGAELVGQTASVLPFTTTNEVTPFFHGYKLTQPWWRLGGARAESYVIAPTEAGDQPEREMTVIDTETEEEVGVVVITV
jgi:hypothetical protein